MRDLSINCMSCKKFITYEKFEEHEMTHNFCKFCLKQLDSWEKIQTHYYKECQEAPIRCEGCIYKLPRKDFLNDHSCDKRALK